MRDNEIDCTKICRMTSTLRDSKYCSKKAEIIDGSLIFGCKKKIDNEPKNIQYLYDCDYWAMNMKSYCKTCPLECIENKNDKLFELKKQTEKINRISKIIRPGMSMTGISSSDIFNVSEVYSKEKADPIVRQALDIADFTSHVFKSAMNGKIIDPIFMKEYAKHAIKNMQILEKKKKIREKIKKKSEDIKIKKYLDNKKN